MAHVPSMKHSTAFQSRLDGAMHPQERIFSHLRHSEIFTHGAFSTDEEVIRMAGKKQLSPVRIATSADVPAPPMSLTDAAEYGTRLDELRAMRRILVSHMENENTLARDLAALTRQVREISKEVDELSRSSEDDLTRAADTSDEKFNPYAV